METGLPEHPDSSRIGVFRLNQVELTSCGAGTTAASFHTSPIDLGSQLAMSPS